jgi:hypothetical protein
MAYKRSEIRGTGSNQWGDKPPLPPLAPTDAEKQRAQEVKDSVAKMASAQKEYVSLDGFVNPKASFSPGEWEDSLRDAVEKFTSGKLGAEGKIFGMFQYIPEGATFPAELIPPLAEKLRSGLFPYDYPDPIEDDNEVVTMTLQRTYYNRMYTQAYNEETENISGIQASDNVLSELRDLALYMDERKPDPNIASKVLAEINTKFSDLDELGLVESNEASHLRGVLRNLRKSFDNEQGFDPDEAKEQILVGVDHASKIGSELRAAYIEKVPEWMLSVQERGYFPLRVANFEKVWQHFKEVNAMAGRAYEFAEGLPFPDNSKHRFRFKKMQKTLDKFQKKLLECKEKDLTMVSEIYPQFENMKKMYSA